MGVEAAVIGMYIAGATAAYTIYSAEEAKDAQEAAARDAERLAHDNADLIEMEGEREQQLAKQAASDIEAEARAKAAVSGLASGGTGDLVMSDLEKKHKDSLAWMDKSTKNQAQITRQGGTYAKRAGYAQGDATRAAGITGAANTIASAGNANNWWA